MDIFAHALWTNVAARIARRRQKRREKIAMKIGWATFWGVFPDLFAFTITFIIGIYGWITAGIAVWGGKSAIASGLAPTLYNYSHSLVIWFVVFCIAWVIFKKPQWALFGWALHILIDIPSHGGGFYLTPFLWPVSNYHFTGGVPWSNPIYMIVNYSLLLIVWVGIAIYRYRQRKKNLLIQED